VSRAGWTWSEPSPPKPTLYERDPEPRPVLYSPDGHPLVPAPKQVGFALPQDDAAKERP
jgi:hypothetical protein